MLDSRKPAAAHLLGRVRVFGYHIRLLRPGSSARLGAEHLKRDAASFAETSWTTLPSPPPIGEPSASD